MVFYPPNAADFSSFGLGALTDTVSCEVTEERNGVFECLLKYPVSTTGLSRRNASSKQNPMTLPLTRHMQLSISESVDAVSNTSTLYWTLSSIGGTSTYYTIDATTVTINGTNVYYKARTAWDDRVFPAAKGSVSGSISVPHNSDGNAPTAAITVSHSSLSAASAE